MGCDQFSIPMQCPAALQVSLAIVGFHAASIVRFANWYDAIRLAEAMQKMVRLARTAQGGGSGWEYTVSVTHLRDFANSQFLVPLAEPLGVRVEELSAGDLIANGNDFCVHARGSSLGECI